MWIEIIRIVNLIYDYLSLPTRECGLKSHSQSCIQGYGLVTPYAGVWIEIEYFDELECRDFSHSLRGSVD